ncbi:MAG: DNA mismatch endonuclease Vsr [Proteobacteria bacterium]|nr:DNA mismatch endonuclease Vsr [Pseudomonadota bacterium]
MADVVNSKKRSEMMSAIKQKNTKPELTVRRYFHSKGLRYSLHKKDLPGKPDLVFPKKKLVVFIHGCFWHRHEGCSKSYVPASNFDFWNKKFNENIARDKKCNSQLKQLGWEVIVIWECQINEKNLDFYVEKIQNTKINNVK